MFLPEAKVSPNLLLTKLFVPPARPNLVNRSHLVQRLNEGLHPNRKLTLVSAPAGYGKTTLVTEWLRGIQVKTAWLSLEVSDNDPVRFLTYLIAALQQIDSRIGESSQALLEFPQPQPSEIVLTTLCNEIADAQLSFILILDDYHLISALPIHQQINFLVEHGPPKMHLVIITREDPLLPIAKLRARGQVLEIRQDELRFNMSETTDFLTRVMGLSLSSGEIAALDRCTEGWITGLQLAALSMQGRENISNFIQAFTGSSRYILDYLIEEVFERQIPEVKDFLLKTSILDRFSCPLCEVVTQNSNSQELLESSGESQPVRCAFRSIAWVVSLSSFVFRVVAPPAAGFLS